MQEFWIFFQLGLKHVLNLQGYDHALFLIALTVPYAFKDWTRILILVSIFTLGHTLALLLSVFNIIVVKTNIFSVRTFNFFFFFAFSFFLYVHLNEHFYKKKN